MRAALATLTPRGGERAAAPQFSFPLAASLTPHHKVEVRLRMRLESMNFHARIFDPDQHGMPADIGADVHESFFTVAFGQNRGGQLQFAHAVFLNDAADMWIRHRGHESRPENAVYFFKRLIWFQFFSPSSTGMAARQASAVGWHSCIL